MFLLTIYYITSYSETSKGIPDSILKLYIKTHLVDPMSFSACRSILALQQCSAVSNSHQFEPIMNLLRLALHYPDFACHGEILSQKRRPTTILRHLIRAFCSWDNYGEEEWSDLRPCLLKSTRDTTPQILRYCRYQK